MDNLNKAQELYNMRVRYAAAALPLEDRINFAAGDKADSISSVYNKLIKKK